MLIFSLDRNREALLNYSSVPLPLRDIPWTRRSLYRGVCVFREGDRAELIYFLDDGLVKLSRDVESHRKTIVRLVRPGELIGDRSLNGVANQKYTAEALSDSICWEVGQLQFQEVCNSSAPVLAWVTEQVEKRLAEVERRIELISFARVEIRLLALLSDLAEASVSPLNPRTENIHIPLSQSEIAQLIGATRETASTTLNQFERRGLLRLGRRQIEVVSLQSMREAASRRDHRADGAHA